MAGSQDTATASASAAVGPSAGLDSSRFAILMATYNGGPYLESQLASLRDQSVSSIDIWVSDDGSSDGSLEILIKFAASWTKGRFEIISGPGAGFADNFRSLLTNPDIDADYVAFCDQDDVWQADKLEAARDWLAGQPQETPSLYCSRTQLIDETGRPVGFSPEFSAPPALRNALVQSIAGGNTMVFNRAAHQLLSQAARRCPFLTHDWWSYLFVTAAGGTVHYSPQARIGYRQHGENIIGSSNSWIDRVGRLDLVLRGRFARWTDMNLAALEAGADLLTPEARSLVVQMRQMRSENLVCRVRAMRKMGLHRQTWLGQISLYAACLLNRL